MIKALFFESEKGQTDGQTDLMPGIINYGFNPLSLLGIIVMRIGNKNMV